MVKNLISWIYKKENVLRSNHYSKKINIILFEKINYPRHILIYPFSTFTLPSYTLLCVAFGFLHLAGSKAISEVN